MRDDIVKRIWECASGECFNCSQYQETTNASVCSKELLHEAADSIEELAQDLEREKGYSAFWEEQAKEAQGKLQKYMLALAPTNASRQWISVNERPPDIGKSIIFATKSGYAAEGEYIGDCWVQYRWATKVKNEAVTHWMPLPEPPKEE